MQRKKILYPEAGPPLEQVPWEDGDLCPWEIFKKLNFNVGLVSQTKTQIEVETIYGGRL